jgi:hypothetical protein
LGHGPQEGAPNTSTGEPTPHCCTCCRWFSNHGICAELTDSFASIVCFHHTDPQEFSVLNSVVYSVIYGYSSCLCCTGTRQILLLKLLSDHSSLIGAIFRLLVAQCTIVCGKTSPSSDPQVLCSPIQRDFRPRCVFRLAARLHRIGGNFSRRGNLSPNFS